MDIIIRFTSTFNEAFVNSQIFRLEVISESDLLPPKIKKQAAADLGQYPKFTDKYTETDR